MEVPGLRILSKSIRVPRSFLVDVMNPSPSLEELHLQLLAGDPTAQAEIACRLFVRIREDLKRKYPSDRFDELVNHAAGEALHNYFQRPEQYDPQKAELTTYLRMSAFGDLKNALRTERNLQEKFRTGVEPAQVFGKEQTREEDPLSALQAKELREDIRKLFPEKRDWQMAELIIDQEHRTEPFAEILGIADWSVDEQRSEVKRHKDRIKQKLRRYGDSLREPTEQE